MREPMIPTTHPMTRGEGRYLHTPTGAGAAVGSGSIGTDLSSVMAGFDMVAGASVALCDEGGEGGRGGVSSVGAIAGEASVGLIGDGAFGDGLSQSAGQRF